MEEQNQNQNQDQDQDQENREGEELLKMLEEEREEEEGEREPTLVSPGSLLSLTEISRQTGIMYTTLKRYGILYDSTDLMGLWEGEGRGKKYHPEAVEVFKRLKAESKKGRPRGPRPDIAPLPPKPTINRGVAASSLPPPASPKKGKKKRAKKGVPNRPSKPALSSHRESSPASIPASLSTQETDRAMAAIERVQLMARYEAVKEMVGTWVWEMERLEKALGLGPENR